MRLLYSPEEVEHAAKEMIGDFLITKQTGAEGRSGHRERTLREGDKLMFLPVLRIHDILGWIRIRIHGSMPLTNGSGSGSCYFVIDLQDASKKQIF